MHFMIYQPPVNRKAEAAPPLINAPVLTAGVMKEEGLELPMQGADDLYTLRLELHAAPHCTAVVLCNREELESLRQELEKLLPIAILRS